MFVYSLYDCLHTFIKVCIYVTDSDIKAYGIQFSFSFHSSFYSELIIIYEWKCLLCKIKYSEFNNINTDACLSKPLLILCSGAFGVTLWRAEPTL